MSVSPFRPDSPLMRAIGRVGDLALINILFLLCSVPIITLGASAAALDAVALSIVREEDDKPARMFLTTFKNNLLQGSLLTLIFLLLGAGLYLDLRFMQANPAMVPFLLRIGTGLVALICAVTLPYVFILQAKFHNSIWRTLKNSFVLAVTHPLTSVACAVLTLLPLCLLVFATYFFLLSSIFWFLFGFSLIALAVCWMIGRILRPLLPKLPSAND